MLSANRASVSNVYKAVDSSAVSEGCFVVEKGTVCNSTNAEQV